MGQPAYHLVMPTRTGSGVVFASPHSGRDYSDSFFGADGLRRRL